MRKNLYPIPQLSAFLNSTKSWTAHNTHLLKLLNTAQLNSIKVMSSLWSTASQSRETWGWLRIFFSSVKLTDWDRVFLNDRPLLLSPSTWTCRRTVCYFPGVRFPPIIFSEDFRSFISKSDSVCLIISVLEGLHCLLGLQTIFYAFF